ncbi:hypothetical protein LTR49_028578, partial [Elasticomyces elasticus]
MAEKSGMQVQDRPKHYQGLSVHGKKRADWANLGRDNILECAEWFMSDAPMRCYGEFAEANNNDKRLEQLAQASGGFEALTRKFLKARSELAIHCLFLGKETPEVIRLLKYIVKAMPNTMETKSIDGLTPLPIVFKLARKAAAYILINAGADQTCRDKSWKNVVHMTLTGFIQHNSDSEKLSGMLDLIDGRTLETILPYSKGAELSSSMVKTTVRCMSPRGRNFEDLTTVLLEHPLGSMYRGNATDRPPFETAEDASLAEALKNPPPMPGGNTG